MDWYLFQQVNNLAGKSLFLDSLAIFFARYFEYFLVVGLLLFLVKDWKRYWKIVMLAFSSAILARLVITNFIRWLWFRPRPFVEETVNLLFEHPDVASFPSGHAAFYFAISMIVYYYNKKVGICFFLASFLICLARVFAGIHWPSDILGGFLVGIFSAYLVFKVFGNFKKILSPT